VPLQTLGTYKPCLRLGLLSLPAVCKKALSYLGLKYTIFLHSLYLLLFLSSPDLCSVHQYTLLYETLKHHHSPPEITSPLSLFYSPHTSHYLVCLLLKTFWYHPYICIPHKSGNNSCRTFTVISFFIFMRFDSFWNYLKVVIFFFTNLWSFRMRCILPKIKY
jgi:hypothetical protein